MYSFFECYVSHRDLHGRTHSLPTRRASARLRARHHLGADVVLGENVIALLLGQDRRRVGTGRGILRRVSSHARGVRHGAVLRRGAAAGRSEEHTSELQSLMRISYAVFCLQNKNVKYTHLTNDLV